MTYHINDWKQVGLLLCHSLVYLPEKIQLNWLINGMLLLPPKIVTKKISAWETSEILAVSENWLTKLRVREKTLFDVRSWCVHIIRLKENNMNTLHTIDKQSIPMGIETIYWINFDDHRLSLYQAKSLGYFKKKQTICCVRTWRVHIIRLKENNSNTLHTADQQSIPTGIEMIYWITFGIIGYDFKSNKIAWDVNRTKPFVGTPSYNERVSGTKNKSNQYRWSTFLFCLFMAMLYWMKYQYFWRK